MTKPLLIMMMLSPLVTLGQVAAPIPDSAAKLMPFYLSARQREVRHKLTSPTAMAVARSGNIYVFDDGNSRIVKLDRGGNFVTEFGQPGTGPGEVQPGGLANAIAVDNQENLYVLNSLRPQIQIFNADGQFVRSFRIPFTVDSVAVNSSGEIFVSAYSSRTKSLIYVFSNEGKFLRPLGDKLISTPGAVTKEINRTVIAIDSRDDLYVAFRFWPLIRKYDRSGKLAAESSFKIPAGLVSESALQHYSLDFFTRNPNISYTLPLLVHSISLNREGGYALLNGHSVVKINGRGSVVRQSRFHAPDSSARALFIRSGGNTASNWLYLLDLRSSNIHKVPRL